MREYKFRGKRLDNGEWVYGGIYQTEFATAIIVEEGVQLKPNDVNGPAEYDTEPRFYDVDPKTVGQYIGRSDIDNREVYHGDVIRVVSQTSLHTVEVGWSDTDSRLTLNNQFGSVSDTTKYRVIGNIHEDPKRLGKAPNVSGTESLDQAGEELRG